MSRIASMYWIHFREPGNLLIIGVLCSLLGIRWIWKAWTGDRLMPGPLMTYIPAWLMYGAGLLMQLPLPVA